MDYFKIFKDHDHILSDLHYVYPNLDFDIENIQPIDSNIDKTIKFDLFITSKHKKLKNVIYENITFLLPDVNDYRILMPKILKEINKKLIKYDSYLFIIFDAN